MMFDTDAMRGAEQTTGQMQNLSLGDAGAGQDPFPASGGVTQLVELFPSYDTGVLEAILASCDGNVEAAIASLLDMGSASESGPVPDDSGAVAAQVNADEELALAVRRLLPCLQRRAAAQSRRSSPRRNRAVPLRPPRCPQLFRQFAEELDEVCCPPRPRRTAHHTGPRALPCRPAVYPGGGARRPRPVRGVRARALRPIRRGSGRAGCWRQHGSAERASLQEAVRPRRTRPPPSAAPPRHPHTRGRRRGSTGGSRRLAASRAQRWIQDELAGGEDWQKEEYGVHVHRGHAAAPRWRPAPLMSRRVRRALDCGAPRRTGAVLTVFAGSCAACLVVAARGGGKTTATVNLVERLPFDRIFVISPSMKSNKEMMDPPFRSVEFRLCRLLGAAPAAGRAAPAHDRSIGGCGEYE
eukprot:630847-Prymnesium_polylepis.1